MWLTKLIILLFAVFFGNVESELTECEKKTAEIKTLLNSPHPPMDLHPPVCDKDGNFERKQCNGMLQVCWCVDPISGSIIPGTTSKPHEGASVKCSQTPVCDQSKDVGSCRGKLPRYYFNKESQKCESFFWGGCQPNDNNFKTLEACQKQCVVTICQRKIAMALALLNGPNPPMDGPVPPKCDQDGNFERKQCTYNLGRRFCFCVEPQNGRPIYRTFSKPGEGSNVDCSAPQPKCPNNMIYSRCATCDKTCENIGENIFCASVCYQKCTCPPNTYLHNNICYAANKCPTGKTKQLPTCQQPPKVGNCRAAILRWFFNTTSQKCETFKWGGCDPNNNNFKTQQNCQAKCVYGPPVCSQPKVIGPCRGKLPRYFYNKKTRKCESFSFGGCKANKNNFKNQLACKKRCTKKRPVCSQPKKVGRCKGRLPRYYYNKKTGKCELFYYGGCRGNGNNFKSQALCQLRCA